MFAALIRASQSLQRTVISAFELKQLAELRSQLDAKQREHVPPAQS